MIVTAHQPNYLPYLGFFHKIMHAEMFVIVDTVQYVKRGPFGWINRNRIRTREGWLWLTVPVLSRGRYTQRIIDTRIDNSTPWGRKHWRSIEVAYRSAPYFPEYRDFFKDIYQRRWEYLADLNNTLIEYLIGQLGIKVKITKTSVLGATGKATDLIIDICQKTNADTYVHGKHGKDYVDQSKCAEHNIKCLWQEFKHPEYPQQYQPFIPQMAVIDLLFNCGNKSLDIIQQC